MHKKRIIPVAILTLMLASCDFSINSSSVDDSTDSYVSAPTTSVEPPPSESFSSTTSVYASFTIMWKNYDGTILEVSHDVVYGTMPVYLGRSPERTPDAEFSYIFSGWSPEVIPATSDATYRAEYASRTNKYTITWQNYDGSVLDIKDVAYGIMPLYGGVRPHKPSDNEFTYTFTGWSPTVSEVVGDATYVATFNSVINEYLVTWKNYDGTILRTNNFKYGEIPVYGGQTPKRDQGSEFTYIFSGWSPEITLVTEDTTYIATFNEVINHYEITWKNYDGTILDVDDVAYGMMPYYGGKAPTRVADDKYNYIFTGWSPEITLVTGKATYIACFDKTYPLRYTLATDNDFRGEKDGEFVYTGSADYVAIPETIKGIKVTKGGIGPHLSLLRDRRDIKGVMFMAPHNIVDLSYLFYNCVSPELDLTQLVTSSVTDMNSMFYFSEAKTLDLSGFDTSKVTNMRYMFYRSHATMIDLSSFDTSNVTNMQSMFAYSQATGLDLSGFNTSKVTTMSYMFSGLLATKLDIRHFNTSMVTDMGFMFYYSQATTIDVRGLDTSKVTDMQAMFSETQVEFLDLRDFDTSNVTNMQSMFAFTQLMKLDVSGFDTSNVTDMQSMFAYSTATSLNLSGFDTSNVTDMQSMFAYTQVTTLDVSGFDTSKVTNMSSMFIRAQATRIDISGFDTSNVTNMEWMFSYSRTRTFDVRGFDTSKVTNMRRMFYSTEVKYLDLSSFDTSNVTDMQWMFADSQLTTLDLSGFDTSKVTNMSGMFCVSHATMIDLSSFDTSNVTDMRRMFAYTQVTKLDVSGFDTSKVTDMSEMFSEIQVEFLDLRSFDTSKVTNMSGTFEDSNIRYGYARNEIEAQKFNDTLGKNVFIVG